MRKEIYKVKSPKRIVFGDPLYFEEYKGDELKRLTVDYKPSEYFDTARGRRLPYRAGNICTLAFFRP